MQIYTSHFNCYKANSKLYLLLILCIPFFIKAQELKTTALDNIITLYNNGDYNSSLTKCNALIKQQKVLKTANDSLALAELYFYKGASQYYLEHYKASIVSYNKAIANCPDTDEGKNHKGKMYYERAFSEYSLGAGLFAYKSSQKALEVLKSVSKPDYNYLLSIYADLAGEASYYGFNEKANDYIQKAYSLYNKHKDKLINTNNSASKPVLFLYKKSTIINNKIEFSTKDEIELSNIIKAFLELKKNKAFNPTENLMYAIALNYSGDFFLRKSNVSQKDIKLAHYYLDNAIRTIDKETNIDNYTQFLFNKAKAYKLDKKYHHALNILNNIISNVPLKDHRLSFFYAEKTNIFLALNKKEKALRFLNKVINEIHTDSIPLRQDFSNFSPSQDINETGLLVEMADIIVKKYPKDSIVTSLASKLYYNGLKQFKNCYQESYLNNKLKTYYDTAIKGILKTKGLGYNSNISPKTILNTIETIENRLAWKHFNLNRQLKTSIIPDSLQYKEIELRSKLVNAKKSKNKEAIQLLKNKLNDHLYKIKTQYPLISVFNYENYNIEDLQKNMANDALILRYKKCNNALFLFTVTKDSINYFEINNAKTILKQLDTYYKTISNMGDNISLANVLYNALIPLSIKTYKTLTIIPDVSISHLPFETLVNNNKQYLVEIKSIAYSPHLVFLNTKKEQANHQKNDLLIFTPNYVIKNNLSEHYRDQNYHLKGAKEETKALQTLFKTKHFEANSASKENFIKNSKSSKVIHLAMHANINTEIPELSYFSFSENTKENKMYLEELYSLKLNSDLVVLSACNTGKDFIKNNNGITSLSRAFTFAGVPSNVASLWSVPDKTTKTIMISFYNHLKKGENKAKALANAKKDYLQQTTDVNLTKPFYWAGFVVNGNTNSIPFKTESKLPIINYILFSIIIILVFIYLYRFIKKTL